MNDNAQEWQILDNEIVHCHKCPRLVAWREEVARQKRRAYQDWDYWGKPVPGFGDPEAKILIVGLAPGAHGSNRTGRMFTGDASGVFLFRALYKAGFANQPEALRNDDGLMLKDIYITAVCRCVPPDNKPTQQEILNCRPFLESELRLLQKVQGVVALGKIGFDGLLSLYRDQGYTTSRFTFAHGALHRLGQGLPWVITSYHPSQQNTQTGRLTEEMFDGVWELAKSLLTV